MFALSGTSVGLMLCAGLLVLLVRGLVPSRLSLVITPGLRRLTQVSPAVVALLALGVNACVSWRLHWPVPATHDEFSYLLAADTFAQGRLTNPPHRHWEHFETFHVLQQPTYQSKFPPAQGLALALGTNVGGHPLVGVWLSHALGCAAVTWMLAAFVPRRWALLGGLLLVANVSVLRSWGQTYWGGALALSGGALFYGGAARIQKCWQNSRPARWRDLLCLALGLTLLANTRPYEGLVASVPWMIALAVTLWRRRPDVPPLLYRQFAVGATLAALIAAGMLVYNRQVTGQMWCFPYRLYEQTYTPRGTWSALLTFWTEARSTPPRRIPTLTDESYRLYGLGHRPLVVKMLGIAIRQWYFHVGLDLSVSLLVLPLILRRPRMKLALLTLGLVAAAILLQPSQGHTHYAAPVTPLVLLVVVNGLRLIRTCRRHAWPTGRDLVLVVGLLVVTHLTVTLAAWDPVIPHHRWSLARDRIVHELLAQGGRHLVFVRYARTHTYHQEWIANAADIDAAPIIWARELDPLRDQALRDDYRDRTVWLLEPDREPLRLIPHANTVP